MAENRNRVGRRVLQYDILAELGRGTFGRVYVARHAMTGQRVALKFLESAATDVAPPADLIREARAVARLSHRGIVTLYGLEECDGEWFLVEEYVEGETLADRLERGPIGGGELARLANELTAALGHAHERGVLHQDIKPANILIAADGTYKLTDFGIARIEGMTPSASSRFRGTLAYSAPERIRGHRGDGRADLFALGGVLYEAMTGHRAFSGSSEAEIVYAVLNETPLAIRPRSAESRCVAEVIERLLAKEPANRPASALVVAELLTFTEAGLARPSWLRSRVTVVIGSIVVLAVGGALLARCRDVPDGPVAVLTFRNVVDPADSARLGLIASAVLASRLASARAGEVLSTESVLEAIGGIKGAHHVERREVARRTHAAWLVTGSILRTDPAILLTAEISSAASDRVMKAVRVETKSGQTVYEAADLLADLIVANLPAHTPSDSGRLGLRLSRDLEADRRYVEGLEHLSRGELRRAEAAFSLSLRLDPSFEAARAALGRALWLQTPEAARPTQ